MASMSSDVPSAATTVGSVGVADRRGAEGKRGVVLLIRRLSNMLKTRILRNAAFIEFLLFFSYMRTGVSYYSRSQDSGTGSQHAERIRTKKNQRRLAQLICKPL
jgi:hypothetical protein